MTPLAEILEAAGIPQEHPTRVLTERAGRRVVTGGQPTLTINGIDMSTMMRTVTLTPVSFTQAEYIKQTQRMVEQCGISLEQWQRELLYGWTMPNPKRFADLTAG